MQQNNIAANCHIIAMHVLLCHFSVQEKKSNMFLAQEQKYLENIFRSCSYIFKNILCSPQKRKGKSQKCPEEVFQNRQHKNLRIERSMFTSSLFLKDFEPTLPISPECALILCGILSISSDFIPYSTLLNIH